MPKIMLLLLLWNLGYATECPQLLLALLVKKYPPQIQSLPRSLSINGPNCHNSSLIWHNIVDELREVTSTEMIEHLKHNFIKLDENATKKWGDIIVFRFGPDDPILHSAIYLDPNTLWQKPGYLKSELWETIGFEQVADEYHGYTIIEYYRKH